MRGWDKVEHLGRYMQTEGWEHSDAEFQTKGDLNLQACSLFTTTPRLHLFGSNRATTVQPD